MKRPERVACMRLTLKVTLLLQQAPFILARVVAWECNAYGRERLVMYRMVSVTPTQRKSFLRAAKAVRAASQTVVAPYLTAKGRALRKARQGILGRLKRQGLTPRWKGAEIEFF